MVGDGGCAANNGQRCCFGHPKLLTLVPSSDASALDTLLRNEADDRRGHKRWDDGGGEPEAMSTESTVWTYHHANAGQKGDLGYTDSSLGTRTCQVTVGSQKKSARRSCAMEPCSQTGGGKVICR